MIKKNTLTRLVLPLLLLLAAPVPSAASEPDEDIHRESLMAQSKGMERRLREQNLFFEDKYAEEYLNGILEKIAAPEEYGQYKLRVLILKNGAALAFAAPDGAIYVCTGLLARVIDEAQVAAVLGHELAHIVSRHSEKNLTAQKFISRTLARAGTQTREPWWKRGSLLLGDGLSGSITGTALRAAIYGYLNEFEKEADSAAIARMAAAGYQPLGDFRQFVNNIGKVENENNKPQKKHVDGGARQENIPGNDVIDKGYFNIKLRNIILYDAVTNMAAGEFELVDTQLERLLSVDSSDVDALLMRGDMERLLSPRSVDCFKWYEKALRHEPGNAVALRAMGFAHHSTGNKNKAREYLRRYSEAAGDDAADIRMVREVIRRCENQ